MMHGLVDPTTAAPKVKTSQMHLFIGRYEHWPFAIRGTALVIGRPSGTTPLGKVSAGLPESGSPGPISQIGLSFGYLFVFNADTVVGNVILG